MLKFQAIAVQLEFLAWRDAQLSVISLQLEDAFPALLDELSRKVEEAGILDLAWSTVSVGSSTEALIHKWGADQLVTAMHRAEAELTEALAQIPGGLNLDSDIWQQVSKTLPAVAGVGLIAASIAAIPTVVSFATVGTSFLAFWGTAAISWPLFAVGGLGLGIATLAGSKTLQYADSGARSSLTLRIHTEAGRRVFGTGEAPGARCILSDIQAAVVQAGQNRIKGTTV